MTPLLLCADSQFVLVEGQLPSSIISFRYGLNTTLQMSGTTAKIIGYTGGTPVEIVVYGSDVSPNYNTPPGTPDVSRVVVMQKPGCKDDCMSLSTDYTGTKNASIIVSDMLAAGPYVRAQVTWADVEPSDELALFYKSILAV